MTTYSYPQYKSTFQRCKKCFKLVNDNSCLTEQICGAIYCSRCLCAIYQSHYLDEQQDIIIEMYCGHYVDRERIIQAVKNNCINCGNKINLKVDLEMRDGIMLCRPCFGIEQKRYKNKFIECISCNRFIRLKQFMADSEVQLCIDCHKHQSQLESTITQNFRMSKASQNTQKVKKQEKKKEESQGVKGYQVPEYVKKQKNRKEDDEEDQPYDISIVSRFSALDLDKSNEVDQKKQKKLKLASKHSVQIRVENLKINIAVNPQKREKCSICKCLIPVQGIMPKKEKEDEASCRVCFMNSFDAKQATAQQSRIRTSADNRRSQAISAPKNKHLAVQSHRESVRPMKKSMLQGDTGGTQSISQLSKLLSFKPMHVSNISPLKNWEPGKIDESRLCDICRVNQYSIKRVDQKKVCRDCYNK